METGSFGTAIFVTILQSRQTIHTAALVVFRQLQLTAAVHAFDDVFIVAALLTLLAVVPALFLGKRNPTAGHVSSSPMME